MADGRQGSLFGDPPPPADRRSGRPVGAAAAGDHAALAERLPAGLRFGTSSWSFPGWEGIVYDRAESKAKLSRRGLEAYARHPLLRAVGVDRTFYAPVAAEELALYAAQVPEDFRFLVKAAAQCTAPELRDETGRPRERNPNFLDSGFASQEVVGPFLEGLGVKAGPLVFQFSPMGPSIVRRPQEFAERLAEFLADLPHGACYAVEVRNRELLCPEYFEALASAGARHCFNVHPRMPPVAEQRRRAGSLADGLLVVRWMLHSGLQYEQARERYEPFSRLVDEDPATRESLADLCIEQALRGQDVVVVANNKAEGSAPLSVFALASHIAERIERSGADGG